MGATAAGRHAHRAGDDERPRVGVVINAGKRLGGTEPEQLRQALARAGWADPSWREVPKSKEAPHEVRRLVEDDGIDRLLVWGGDGTVRRCADTILRHGYAGVALGVLPAGTSNVLAQSLGIPEDLEAAVEVALRGDPVAIDAGVVNDEEHFLVRAGTGFDALLIRDADDYGWKERFGRLGYLRAAVRHRDARSVETRVTVDGEPWFTGRSPCVIVGNVGKLMGGLSAFPDAEPDDGRLDVGVVEAQSSWDWARLVGSVLARRVASSPLARTTTARRITIELNRSVPWQVDGGDRHPRGRFDVRCIPSAISIYRPTPREDVTA